MTGPVHKLLAVRCTELAPDDWSATADFEGDYHVGHWGKTAQEAVSALFALLERDGLLVSYGSAVHAVLERDGLITVRRAP